MPLRIGVAASGGQGLDAMVADRFGRAEKFVIVDIDEERGKILKVETHDNPGYSAGSGAGVKAAQKLGDLGVKIYVGPTPGPNAYAALQYLGIKIYTLTGVTVREAVEAVIRNLPEILQS
ncbi:MAG: NifB/NifX family molybdenum-iron cluster-binding protein [Desulfurococcales archaeon]|nr:NifB/NifX family molybdenum-iron cluster-binding protein [Desulfurococcales archaeon]